MKVFDVCGGNTLSLSLFTDVTNSKLLQDLIQAGTLEPEVALLNASIITDVLPVLVAVHKALVAKFYESLKRCGFCDSSTYMLAAVVNASRDDMKAVGKLIDGNEIDLELEARANRAQIQTHYKIFGVEAGLSSIAHVIACRIAARYAL